MAVAGELPPLGVLLAEALQSCRTRQASLHLCLRQTIRRRIVANSAGGFIVTVEAWVGADVTVRTPGATLNQGLGSTLGWADVDLLTAVEAQCRRALRPRRPLPGGNYRVVLGPDITGLLVHEVLGHQAEGDTVLSLKERGLRPGQEIASPLVSVFDDPALEGPFGHYVFDDEGVRGRKTCLVEEGLFVSPLHSLTTGAEDHRPSTGHGRALNWRYAPIPRMSTTYMSPGRMTLDELFEDTSRGLYLEGARGGTGGRSFVICATDSAAIRNGRIVAYGGPALVRGELDDTLRKVDGVSSAFLTPGGGEGGCGKDGQFPLPVAAGGPHIRVSRLEVLT